MAVSSIASSGGDYTTTQAWYDAKDALDGEHIAEIANEAIAGALLFNNPPGDTSPPTWIVRPASDAFHDGTSRDVSGSGAQLSASGTSRVITISFTEDVTIEDLDCKSTANVNVLRVSDASIRIVIQRCIVHGSTVSAGISIVGATASCKTHSNIIYDNTWGIDARPSGNSAGEIIGNTVYGNGLFGILPGTVAKVAMNISVNHSNSDYLGTNSATGTDYNIAADATANTEMGSNSINSVEVLETGDNPTGDFVAFVKDDTSLTTIDLHIIDIDDADGDNVAINGGVTASGWTTDIDRETRDVSSPYIGADEIAASGFVPYPRYAMTGGMQSMQGGL